MERIIALDVELAAGNWQADPRDDRKVGAAACIPFLVQAAADTFQVHDVHLIEKANLLTEKLHSFAVSVDNLTDLDKRTDCGRVADMHQSSLNLLSALSECASQSPELVKKISDYFQMASESELWLLERRRGTPMKSSAEEWLLHMGRKSFCAMGGPASLFFHSRLPKTHLQKFDQGAIALFSIVQLFDDILDVECDRAASIISLYLMTLRQKRWREAMKIHLSLAKKQLSRARAISRELSANRVLAYIAQIDTFLAVLTNALKDPVIGKIQVNELLRQEMPPVLNYGP